MPQITDVTVANLALGYTGEEDISALTDTGSKAARALNSVYDAIRRECLALRNWSFASRTRDLVARAAHAEFPLPTGETAFPLGADVLRFDELVEPHPLNCTWRIEQGPQGEELRLDTTAAPTVRVVVDHETPARWSPLFIKLFAAELALRVMPKLNGDKAGREQAKRDRRDALREATSLNLQTKPIKPHAGTPFTLARRRAGSSVLDAGQHPGG